MVADTPILQSRAGAATTLIPTTTVSPLRQNFVPLKNEPGVQVSIAKARLSIDSQYQRKLNERQVAVMAANWNWTSCGVLEVSRRPGSTIYFVVDGQHRLKAASYLAHIKELPCIIFELDTVRDEAIAFLASNTNRRMPTISDQFKALIMAGDPIAMRMTALAESHSRTIGIPADAQHITCVSAFATMLRTNTAAMERVFPLAAQVCAGHPMPARILWAFHHLERCMPRGESLADDRWRERIARTGHANIVEEIRKMGMLDSKGGARAYATGLLRAINRGLRQPLTANVDLPRR